jgi:hypothetical protein
LGDFLRPLGDFCKKSLVTLDGIKILRSVAPLGSNFKLSRFKFAIGGKVVFVLGQLPEQGCQIFIGA